MAYRLSLLDKSPLAEGESASAALARTVALAQQPEAVRLYLSHGYQPQFDTTRDPEEYSRAPYDGRLRFTKALHQHATTGATHEID